jgi:hypothetical protein
MASLALAAAPLSGEEIEERLPVWCALAKLFLDTKLQPHDFDWIAKVLSQAGLSTRSAEEILNNEVAPVFVLNLLNAAGEPWGWQDEGVGEAVLAHLRSDAVARAGKILRARWRCNLYKHEWQEVAKRLKNTGRAS